MENKIKYTKEQQETIDIRNRNVLVSAAAGSGKTAVLVARIITMITDKKNRISIDELLIVTFTKSAAAEMKERIGSGIEKAIEEATDENVLQHLMKQLAILPTASIMTLHSFCLRIVKENYHRIGLDPNFRIGKETELQLLRETAMNDTLEMKYELGEEAFIDVVESYAHGKTDDALVDIIYAIYRYAISNPWPQKWLQEMAALTKIDSLEAVYESSYYAILVDRSMQIMESLKERLQEALEYVYMENGPIKYKEAIESLIAYTHKGYEILKDQDFEKIPIWIESYVPQKLGRNPKGYDKELAEEAKVLIDSTKKELLSIRESLYIEEEVVEETQKIHKNIKEVVKLTEIFMDEYVKQKQEKGIIDFNDFEHFALSLLYEQENGELKYSEIAKVYKEQFKEILVDEYQDINDVQEAILLAVDQNHTLGNRFMVGDIKQSIYKFRLAKPEIFKEKYESYGASSEGERALIELAKNFRSREEVLHFTNHIFEKVMSKNIGDVAYDQKVKLYFGADYYTKRHMNYTPEVITILSEEATESAIELEAKAIALKIKELMETKVKIYDKERKEYRQIAYSDICILARSPKGFMNELGQILKTFQIPYYSDVTENFFAAIEVQIMLNYLRIIDNRYQDIPLLSVLRSSLVSIDEDELLRIRDMEIDAPFWDCVIAYAEVYEDELANKLLVFIQEVKSHREQMKTMPIHEFLTRFYRDSGYLYSVAFRENGKIRVHNLQQLIIEAKNFESTSFSGVFQFIRYIEQMEKYQVEDIEPVFQGEDDKKVSIMSIHKSKGLEFPIVFLVNTGKQFNVMDTRNTILMDQDIGFGSYYIDTKKRYKKKNFIRTAISTKLKKELYAEEVRVLYVALTRAREKLYIYSHVKKEEKLQKLIGQQKVSEYDILKASSYIEWILLALSKIEEGSIYTLETKNQEQIEREMEAYTLLKEEKSSLLYMLEDANEKDTHAFKDVFSPYPFIEDVSKKTVVSVSELKRLDKERIVKIAKEESEMPTSDKKTMEEKAAFGTLIHKVFSLLPDIYEEIVDTIGKKENTKIVEEIFRKLVERKILTIEESETIEKKAFLTFIESTWFEDMMEAKKKNLLYTEQPFVLGLDELMIQGVIDSFYIKDSQVFLLDYKTDQVHGKPKVLEGRYKEQMKYYKKAIEDILEVKVAQTMIYSYDAQTFVKIAIETKNIENITRSDNNELF